MINKSVIERYGEGDYICYRIPGVVVTAKGTVVVYYETRTQAVNDWSTRGVGMKRSTDGGKSFGEKQQIAYCEDVTVNNPVMIASKDGSLHFLWQKDYRQTFYQISLDDGLTFSEPVCITKTFEQFKGQLNWSLYALGPGHGIELSNGRLVVPVWLANGEGNNHYPTHVSTIISDDKGKSWYAGEVIFGSEDTSQPFVYPNETQAVELSDGTVMLNIRHNGKNHFRYTSISPNGKDCFSAPQADLSLPDSICFGSLVKANYKNDILFVNCINRENANNGGYAPRRKLTVHLSEDDAKTWKCSALLAEVGGYADIAASNDGKNFYCFFEHENPPENGDPLELVLAVFDREWITKNQL